MDIGKLDKLVKIQRLVGGLDSFGQPEEDWQDLATVWGSCTDLSGKEFLAAQAVNSQVSSKVVIRYRLDVDASARLIIDAQVYLIEYPLVGGRNQYLTLMCKRG